jgi:hypothetical protein
VDPLASLALLIADLNTQIRVLQEELLQLREQNGDTNG